MTQEKQKTRIAREKLNMFFGEIYQIWITEKPAQFAAALAYYAVFSFVPLIYLVFAFADLIFAKLSVSQWFYSEAATLLGEEVAVYVQNGVAILAERSYGDMSFTSIIGLVALIFSASMIFTQLQHTLNTIWRVPPPVRGATHLTIRNRLFAFIVLPGTTVIFILATVINFIISVFAIHIKIDIVVSLIGFISLMGLATVVFMLIYMFLANVQIDRRDVLVGSVVAGFLIAIITHILGAYLGAARFSSALESAGAIAVLLISFYMLGQIFVMGAVITRVYAAVFGSGISPRG